MAKLKLILLISAAGLSTLSVAQAADLPIKAKAIEYLKICSLYGAGFYYMPGTDTCLKLGGYLRVETALNSGGHYNGQFTSVAAAHNQLTNHYSARSRANFNIDTRTATGYGTVRTYFEAVYTWTSGSYNGLGNTPNGTVYTGSPAVLNAGGALIGGLGNPNDGGIAGGGMGVYFAFIQFAGFEIGKSVSQFDAPWTNYPGNNFDQLVGGSGATNGVNQFTYTADFGQGVTASISAEDPVAFLQAANVNLSGGSAGGMIGGSYGSNNIAGTRSPNLVGTVRAKGKRGLFQASVAAHNNNAGYYGATEITGHPADKWGWAAQVALSISNIPTGPGDEINMQAVYTDGATRYNFQSLAAIGYSMFGGTSLAGAYQSIGFAQAPDTVFVNGSAQETVKTWGFRGAYTHNWDAYWNTAIYGAYAQVRFGTLGTTAICANMVGLLALTGNCDPNFAIGQLGIITRWTPVKKFVFSADLNWSRLDQKYTGTVTAPQVSSTAKPAAIYELKDQNSITLLLRAQRNW